MLPFMGGAMCRAAATGGIVMAKGRDKAGREKKKPKADKKPSSAATPFLRPTTVTQKPATKAPAKPE
ncbi:MAG: hypothetical protein IT555_18755 [Acetobacteraceae bacterium]|nr:hypothetical protein [Acetobacteraceae bacterium]